MQFCTDVNFNHFASVMVKMIPLLAQSNAVPRYSLTEPLAWLYTLGFDIKAKSIQPTFSSCVSFYTHSYTDICGLGKPYRKLFIKAVLANV